MRLSKPLTYNTSPFYLLLNDFILFNRISFIWPPIAGLPSIIIPFLPLRSGALDELYPSLGNLWSIALQLLLIIVQISFLLSLIPSALIGIPIPFYAPIYFGYIAIFVLVNKWCSVLLNGKQQRFCSKVDLTAYHSHDDERWIFINGVGVGQHWLQSNLDRLALAFRRPVLGIHNQTRGIIFDVFECVIQRDFRFDTADIRAEYEIIANTLSNEQYKKVVLVLHSQGAIEGGMVLDWLYASLPSEQVARLEVYTFGNAANHFNAPIRSCLNPQGRRADQPQATDRIIKHIEHYANTGDWVSKFGILNFRPCPAGRPKIPNDMEAEENRFVGRLFKRDGMGHQMTGNYLDNLFPMNSDMTEVLENNEYMDSIVDMALVRSCDAVTVQAHGGFPNSEEEKRVRVKDLSRLWMYRNGMSPED